jgi:hypothetical protein
MSKLFFAIYIYLLACGLVLCAHPVQAQHPGPPSDYRPQLDINQRCPPGLPCGSTGGGGSGLGSGKGGELPPPVPYVDDMHRQLRLTNVARQIGNGLWQWTAYIEGSAEYLAKIDKILYRLHPTFQPNVRIGNARQKGHPITVTGYGPFLLEAEVWFVNGSTHVYEHFLQF